LQVKALADQMITQVVCGGDHTLAVNNDGEIFAVNYYQMSLNDF
jgi:alpha-tubulin suppressor-like RCC1 family protein